MTLPRFGEENTYENTPDVFIPPADRELQRILDEGCAEYERARVRRDLGLEGDTSE